MPGLSDAATVAELNRSWQSFVEVGAPEKAQKVLETALVVIAGADFDASERRKQLVTTLHNLASWYAGRAARNSSWPHADSAGRPHKRTSNLLPRT